MRILIDMQGVQVGRECLAGARDSLAFAQAVVRARNDHEVVLVLNGLLPHTIEHIRVAFEGLLPQDRIRVWTTPGPLRAGDPGGQLRRCVAERLREAYLRSLEPDVIHLSSLWDEGEDNVVTSIGRFDTNTFVTVSLWDRTSWASRGEQRLGPAMAGADALQDLRRASMCFVETESHREEAIQALGLEPMRVLGIGSSWESLFRLVREQRATLGQHGARKSGLCAVLVHALDCGEHQLRQVIQAYAALPPPLRAQHQLVLVGELRREAIELANATAVTAGLADGELVLTGAMAADERLQLVKRGRLCLCPDWSEGVCSLALEAMACGVPVVGAHGACRPTYMDLAEALFEHEDDLGLSQLLVKALQDDVFFARLRSHGLNQVERIVWDGRARQAVCAWEQGLASAITPRPVLPVAPRKPRLAYVSPLPPERTGIADYSAQLLPALAAYYDIEVVVAQGHVDDAWVASNGPLRDIAWLRANADAMDRVMYHVGNSSFHAHMPELLDDVPGTVVLHDFYLGGLMGWLELHGGQRGAWSASLYESHGYAAMRDRFLEPATTQQRYPANWGVLKNARGVIVHSKHSCELAQQWYGEKCGSDWAVIPLLRIPTPQRSKPQAREALGLGADDFVVCSFGFINANKLHHRLLRAWLASDLSKNPRCRLIFVGDNPSNEFGAELVKTIRGSGARDRIQITGFASAQRYQDHLFAADMAVQLRTDSRGETSAAVLDCMNHALPVVVNGNGALAELDEGAVHMLPDQFADAALVDALELMWRDSTYRETLGSRARAVIREHHAPDICAHKYFQAIEAFHVPGAAVVPDLVARMAVECAPEDETSLVAIASAMEQNFPPLRPARRLLLDVTATAQNDLKTGIERVVRALLMALIESPPAAFRVEPIHLIQDGGVWRYEHARSYAQSLLGCPPAVLSDDPVVPEMGDMLVVADFSGDRFFGAAQSGLFEHYRRQGVLLYAVVYDLLPIRMPLVFPPSAGDTHERWLHTISQFDGAVCISRTVAEDLVAWRAESGISVSDRRSYRIGWWHLGADLSSAAPSRGKPRDAGAVLSQLRSRPSFLMVGTIEPRKGHLQAIEAFTELWCEGLDVNVVIVGKEGWKGLPDSMRRTIPDTIKRLRAHPELGRRLFWIEGGSDEYLEEIYAASTCLLAASHGEGFGLPLIEAAQHRIPMVVRDIPVFREVAGPHAYYFKTPSPRGLAHALKDWLGLYRRGLHPVSTHLLSQSWKASAEQLVGVIAGGRWLTTQVSEDVRKAAAAEYRYAIHQARIRMVRTQLPPGDVVLDLSGGHDGSLIDLGYAYGFKRLYRIAPCSVSRREVLLERESERLSDLRVSHVELTDLDQLADGSVDLVWFGQGIQDLSPTAARQLCRAAFRVLRPGGHFCLDTPNRLVTRIYTRDFGGGYIHPEHCFEYEPAQLRQLLEASGFDVQSVKGICEMPSTIQTGKFDHTDFLFGRTLCDKVDAAYLQYFHCIRGASPNLEASSSEREPTVPHDQVENRCDY